MKKLFWRSFVLSLLLLLIVLPASAFALPYAVAGKSINSGGGNTLGYGCLSHNYVMSNPTLKSPDGMHVNSIYVVHNPDYNVEVGWYRRYGLANPQGFTVQIKNGVYTEIALGAMIAGQYADLKIESQPGTDNWKTYVNGTLMYTWPSSGFTAGYPAIGSERKYNPGDSNYGNFQNLQFREGNTTWKYWINIVADFDNDSIYKLYPDNPNHKAIVDVEQL